MKVIETIVLLATAAALIALTVFIVQWTINEHRDRNRKGGVQ